MLSQIHSIGEKLSQPQRFVTLTKADPEFNEFMNGRGPKGFRAVALESFAINSQNERVTFALFEAAQILPPPWTRLVVGLFRLDLLSATIAPCLLAFAALLTRGYFFDWTWALILLAVFSLHVATFALNDFYDHWRGVDRLTRSRGSQVIQKGWVSANFVWWIGLLGLVCAIICGLFLLGRQPAVIALLGLIALVAVVGFSFSGRGFKYQGVGDAAIGLCLGPLMGFGLAIMLAPEFLPQLMLLTLPLGLSSVILFQMRHLETIIAERRVRTGTLVARLGFDKAKIWLAWEMSLLPAFSALALWQWQNWYIGIGALFVVTAGLWPLRRRLRDAASPMSSHLLGLSRHSVGYQLGLAALLLVGLFI